MYILYHSKITISSYDSREIIYRSLKILAIDTYAYTYISHTPEFSLADICHTIKWITFTLLLNFVLFFGEHALEYRVNCLPENHTLSIQAN